ncbi:MAG: phosphatase PAP2 family protein [Geodermatophilaceae bacterium]|nr:phosphatase PAP2 family protein [Geodermatophilaceae bacterium]MDQ3463960.1 phosphatase PAP2 family protein [Actinomycetota bacterium]
MARAPSRLDRRIYHWVQRLPPSPADQTLLRLSQAANHGRLWFAVAAVLGARKGKGRRAAVRAVGSLAVSSSLTNVVAKQLFDRMRPDYGGLAPLRRLRREPITSSFPSGHSASAGAFATAVAMESPLLGAAVAPLAAAVAYSRVHVGVHYPGDVVAGVALGAGVALSTRHWWPVHPAVPARVRLTGVAPALPGGEGLVITVNPRSGPEDVNPADELRELLPRAEVIELGENDDMAELLAAAADRAKAFGVAGGDGSVATAARLALKHELPLAVVPAGTLNHFARDVGIDTPEAAVEAINTGAGVCVDVATVGGVPFLNNASIGGYPEMVERREALEPRFGKWPALFLAAMSVLRTQEPLQLELNGKRAKVWILFVGNCFYTPRGLSPAWRPRLEDGLLDVQYLRADKKFSRARLVLTALAGATHMSRMYRQLEVRELTVRSLTGPVQLARDGELGESAVDFHFTKTPRRLVVYRPAEVPTE